MSVARRVHALFGAVVIGTPAIALIRWRRLGLGFH